LREPALAGGCFGVPMRGPAIALSPACSLSVMFRRRFLGRKLDFVRSLACHGAGARCGDVVPRRGTRPRAPASPPRSPSCFAGDSCEGCWIAGAGGRLRWHAKARARHRAPPRPPALHHVSQEIPVKEAGFRALAGVSRRGREVRRRRAQAWHPTSRASVTSPLSIIFRRRFLRRVLDRECLRACHAGVSRRGPEDRLLRPTLRSRRHPTGPLPLITKVNRAEEG